MSDNETQLFFNLHDWAPGCPNAFPSEQADAMRAQYEPLALDALVASGIIRPEDRSRVTFIVMKIVESPHRRANVDYTGS
ncbi:MAG TPA: hypothetical protein VIG52_10865, partial [Methyloceanibacter sp.]